MAAKRKTIGWYRGAYERAHAEIASMYDQLAVAQLDLKKSQNLQAELHEKLGALAKAHAQSNAAWKKLSEEQLAYTEEMRKKVELAAGELTAAREALRLWNRRFGGVLEVMLREAEK